MGGTTLPARPHACRRYLKVRIRENTYGIPASQVREIVYCPEISETITDTPRAYALANLRGHVVPVIDAARLVLGEDLCRADLTPSCLLVLEVAGVGEAHRVLGLLVDGVEEVVQVRDDPSQAPAPASRSVMRGVSPGSLRMLEPLIRDFLAG